MKRAFLLITDSFGIGASLDAKKYGDEAANTFANIAKHCDEGLANIPGTSRQGVLKLPNLSRLGLNAALKLSCGQFAAGLSEDCHIEAAYGYAIERSYGKDTPSGHWEIAGLPALFKWGYFLGDPSFPKELLSAFISRGNIPGILGNKHASGTDILTELGDEHMKTGKPIVYTSADSVFQIAAHEESFGLERLYSLCDLARELVNEYNIGRVIARPFLGENGEFTRTGNRRDIAIPPPADTLLDINKKAGNSVIGIGKIGDIYAHQGLTEEIKAHGNQALFDAMLTATKTASDKTLMLTNFVDFDMLYGHRRDVAGYAKALEEFDARLPEFEALMQPGDIAIITADHGCDPTQPGSDHTREHIPVLLFGPGIKKRELGGRSSFADIGQTIAKHLELPELEFGTAF